ncbi:MAG: flavin reductase family protein [Lentisphaerales bacterium]|nr:flavin reductase family protein [Lentisphaerales bacterium]
MMNINNQKILAMEKRYRTNFINCLSGFKSINLVGTISQERVTNLAPVSSVIHVGANPPLMGMLIRPNTVPRNTLENIMTTGQWSLNHITEDFYKAAHHCSARYAKNISEFEQSGLTEEYLSLHCPYVKEASVKIGLTLKERIDIEVNGTHFLIGEVQEVVLPEDTISEDGFIDLELCKTITVSGLDKYHRTASIDRLPYAKVRDESLKEQSS